MLLHWAAALCLLAVTVSGTEDACFVNAQQFCNTVDKTELCNSKYSSIHHLESNLQKYTAIHLDYNWHFLLMAAQFGNFQANREGFSKLFRKLADDAWDDSLDLIKYMAKRGFNMNYDFVSNIKDIKAETKANITSYVMNELLSISKALDMQKVLAVEAHKIHRESGRKSHEESGRKIHEDYHDAETMDFIQKKFVGKHSETIRNLAGHANDLHSLIYNQTDSSLSIYLFDEYLKKIIV